MVIEGKEHTQFLSFYTKTGICNLRNIGLVDALDIVHVVGMANAGVFLVMVDLPSFEPVQAMITLLADKSEGFSDQLFATLSKLPIFDELLPINGVLVWVEDFFCEGKRLIIRVEKFCGRYMNRGVTVLVGERE